MSDLKKLNRSRGHRRLRPVGKFEWILLILFCLLFGGFFFFAFGFPLIGCNIKGNISIKTGERIYHVPGQHFYDVTRINWLKGERWFCSEEAARSAGWRKSMR